MKDAKKHLKWFLSSSGMALAETALMFKTGLMWDLWSYLNDKVNMPSEFNYVYQPVMVAASAALSYATHRKKVKALASTPLHNSLFDAQVYAFNLDLPEHTSKWAIEAFGTLGHVHDTIPGIPVKYGYLLAAVPYLAYKGYESLKTRRNKSRIKSFLDQKELYVMNSV